MENYWIKMVSHLFIPVGHPRVWSVSASKKSRATNSLEMGKKERKKKKNGKTEKFMKAWILWLLTQVRKEKE